MIDSWRANGVAPSAALGGRRYSRRVFVAPPWREIYQTDAERRQDWPEAEATFERILSNLEELGYEALVLPKADVEERVQYVLEAAA